MCGFPLPPNKTKKPLKNSSSLRCAMRVKFYHYVGVQDYYCMLYWLPIIQHFKFKSFFFKYILIKYYIRISCCDRVDLSCVFILFEDIFKWCQKGSHVLQRY